ncbi:MAG: hypoxanthine phosphoribosyltransferase [Firmicutes bacterium]|nr:hypoxanthine phosphoribosyltransferase [Bacillota bacterium]
MEKKYAFGETVISQDVLKARVQELGREIAKDYGDESIMAICILKGAVIFMTDLVRAIGTDVKLDFMAVSSYGNSTKSSGVVKIVKDLDTPIAGENLLIVEDIIDSGRTLKYLKENLESRGPKSIKICTLLDKPARRVVDLKPDYIGFEIEDQFIVGYGLDYAEHFRNLPYIASLVEDEAVEE